MSADKFKSLLKTRIKENAFEYLLKRRGSKGQGLHYSTLEMSEYLLPHNDKMNVDEKRDLFSLKNRMIQLPCNFGNPNEKCICGADENMLHVYSCLHLNERKEIISFDKLNTGNISDQIEILQRFKYNMERRNEIKQKMKEQQSKQMKENSPCDLHKDPLNCNQCRFG